MVRPPSSEDATARVIGNALHLQQIGNLEAAEAGFREALRLSPDHPHALHFLALLLHQRGMTEPAIELLERAVSVSPHDLDARNNLGNLYIFANRGGDAEVAFRAILKVAPHFPSARFNLGVLLARARRWVEAELELARAAREFPDADVYGELADAFYAQQKWSEAVSSYHRALGFRPDDTSLRKRLSAAYDFLIDVLYQTSPDTVVAIPHIRRWLEIDPDSALAAHMLAAATGDAVPDRCSDAYVRDTFDRFADSFDQVLETLAYSGVKHSVQAFQRVLEARGAKAQVRSVLDLGCGTGALGPSVRARTERLVGVDLSPKMVAKTVARGIYDEVVTASAISFLEAHPGEYEVVVCADTVIYFGDVAPLFTSTMRSLSSGGYFIFTAEEIEGEKTTPGFLLHRHGRYCHHRLYLERVVRESGGAIERVDHIAAIRRENGLDVPALIVTARRA